MATAVGVSPQSTLADAFAYCEKLARSHYENFTVVSWFLPKRLRPSLYSVYAFCRYTDDLGDEAIGDRLHLLDDWEADLRRCYDSTPKHPILIALQDSIQRHQMPQEPFLRLIEANRMDQRNSRYQTYEDLLRYCDHSANPVGRMVLSVFGYSDLERQLLSDATCTALQFTNFWQDVGRDLRMGRVYIPLEDMAIFNYSVEELQRGVVNNHFRLLMAFEVQRARKLFRQGGRLVDIVGPELRVDLKLFTLGGIKVLDAIEANDFDVLSTRPSLSKAQKLRLMLSAMVRLKFQGRAPSHRSHRK